MQAKTRAGRRVIPLPASMTDRLRAHRRWRAAHRLRLGIAYEDQGLVFANRTRGTLEPQILTRRDLKTILRRAKLPETIRWYDLRHACATLLLAASENVKVVAERLGHAKTTLTLDLYAHVLPGMQESAAIRLDAMLFGRGNGLYDPWPISGREPGNPPALPPVVEAEVVGRVAESEHVDGTP